MASNQWRRIEELFQAASELPAAARAAYLNRECTGDEILRREVESLLEESDREHNFIEEPALNLGLKVLFNQGRKLTSGQSIGHYKVLRPLGSGGMGEVYLAEDCKLERQVALKFLVHGITDNHWAKDQLKKEARTVARLEHSNICGVYDLEEIGDDSFIVMQYVEGETLASLLQRETPGLDRALDFAEQTINALAAAHLHGIIHRDIKPQNIVVTPEGQIKVLDFGLAKFVKAPDINLPDQALEQTAQIGLIMGTVSYMSPEQIRGETLDGRSDVFSFGIVLCEMLCGRNPFARESRDATLLAIKEEDPDVVLRTLPEGLDSVVHRCLEKDRSDRYESANELLAAIRNVRQLRERRKRTFLKAVRQHRHFQKYVLATVALAVGLFALAGWIYAKATHVHSLAILPIKNTTNDTNLNYLSTGLTKNLFDKFSYLPRLQLQTPSTAPSSTPYELTRVARDLNVEAVMTGEIYKVEDKLLLRVRVFRTEKGAVSLETNFDVDPATMLRLQEDITHKVSDNLGLWLIGDEKKLLDRSQTNNDDALRSYMLARSYYSAKRSKENVQAAVDNYERAIKLDPAFAKAYAGLSETYGIMQSVAYGSLPNQEAVNRARWNALRAIEIDNKLPEAHTALGIVRLKFTWEWEQAEKDFTTAISLDPEHAPAHYWYSNLLALMHRFDEAIRESQRARELDPYSPLPAMNYGRALYYARRFDEAYQHFDALLNQSHDDRQFLNMMGLVQIQRNDLDGAITTLEKLRSLDPVTAAAPLGFAYAKKGRRDEALEIIKQLDEASKKQTVPVQEKAIVYVGLGDFDSAFQLFEQAYDERFPAVSYLNTDPIYDGLKGDPHFESLVTRLRVAR